MPKHSTNKARLSPLLCSAISSCMPFLPTIEATALPSAISGVKIPRPTLTRRNKIVELCQWKKFNQKDHRKMKHWRLTRSLRKITLSDGSLTSKSSVTNGSPSFLWAFTYSQKRNIWIMSHPSRPLLSNKQRRSLISKEHAQSYKKYITQPSSCRLLSNFPCHLR